MKRPPAELVVAVVLVIIVILVSNIRFGIMTGGSPCHPRAQLVISPNETIIVELHMLSGQLDGLFVKVWQSDSQPPDARISGICYVSGADGIRRVNSDDLTLYTGQSIICYFNSTQANGGVPSAKGKTYYFTVYGRSCGRIGQLAPKGLFIAGIT